MTLTTGWVARLATGQRYPLTVRLREDTQGCLSENVLPPWEVVSDPVSSGHKGSLVKTHDINTL